MGYWRLRLADNRLTWSPGIYRLLGIAAYVAPDNDWFMAQFVEADAVQMRAAIATAIAERAPFAYRARARHAQMPAHTIDTHGEVEVDAEGRALSLIGVCHDVTRQVTAESEREKTQNIFRVMAEEASDIIMLHEDERIVFASGALDRILKRTKEEVQAGGYVNLTHPDDRGEALKLRGWPGPGETWTATYRGLHGDGHYVWLEARTRGIYDEATGEFRQEISVTRDVTERKEQELKMRAAQ